MGAEDLARRRGRPGGGAVVVRTTSSRSRRCTRARGTVPFERPEKDLGPPPSALEERLAHGREPDVGRRLDVVEADDRQVAGHVEPGLPGRLDHPEGLHVGRGEHRGGTGPTGEEVAHQLAGHLAAVGPVAHPIARIGVLVETGLGQHLAVALLALGAGGEAERGGGIVADEGDALVTEVHEMAGGHPPALDVVGDDLGHAPGPRVDQHDGHARTGDAVSASAGGGSDRMRSPSARSRRVSEARCSSRWRGDSTLKSTRS